MSEELSCDDDNEALLLGDIDTIGELSCNDAIDAWLFGECAAVGGRILAQVVPGLDTRGRRSFVNCCRSDSGLTECGATIHRVLITA